jgi:hypothetical protein
MRALKIRHPFLHDLAHCLLDLYPSDADVSEVGLEHAPCLFVHWRTSGVANHPGNIAWGVHYRFEPDALRLCDTLEREARREACERVREISRHLRFDYADPQAASLLVVDLPLGIARA